MTDRPRLVPALLLAVAAGATAVPLLGPLVLGVLDYHVSGGASDQVRGGDVAGLLLVAPVAATAAWRVRRRLAGGYALALPPAAYGLYAWSQATISGDLGRYAGNAERFFPLFATLVVCCGAVLVLAGREVLRAEPPAHSRRLRRACGWYFLAAAAFLLVGLHLPGLVDSWREQPQGAEYAADPVVFWVVKLMDLGYVVPLLAAVGVALLQGRSTAVALLAPVSGWCALLASSVAGMAVVMLATDAAGASPGLAVGMVTAAIAAVALAVRAYLPIVAPARERPVTRSPAAPARV